MQFIWKFFRALNSAQTPFQITFALALGMLMGLTPVSGIQTFVILLLAFVLNIHLGMFFLASAFFAGVGYLFDPWLEQLGYTLLSNEALAGFWSALYANGLARMSMFNNTLVLGSSVAALLLALPLVLLLNRLISLYRIELEALLQRHPFFGKFGLLSVAEKPLPLFRWWGAGAFGAVAALVGVFVLLVADPLFKKAIESTLGTLLQRPVSVASATVHFTDFSMEVSTLEIASQEAGKNALSVETIRFDPDMFALLQRKLHIAEFKVGGIGFDTPSRNPMPAAVPESTEEEKESNESVSLPSVALPSAESLLKSADLGSLKRYESAQKEIDAISAKWQKVADEELNPKILSDLEGEFAAIQKKAQSKDPQTLLSLKGDVEAFTAKIDVRQKRLGSIEKEFGSDTKRLEKLLGEVEAASMADFNRLKSAYALSGSGTMNIIGALFGEKIKNYLQSAQHYYEKLAPYLKSEKKEEVPPPARGEGRWIRFAAESPQFWIERTSLDGALNGQSFNAKMADLSDNQKALQRPMRLALQSDGKRIEGLKIDAEFNHLGEKPLDSVNFGAKRYVLDAMELSPVSLSPSDLAFSGKIALHDTESLSGEGRLDFGNVKLSAADAQSEYAAALNKALKEVKGFSVDASLKGSLGAPDIAVSSDLDKKLSGAMERALANEAAAQTKRLKKLLNEQSASQLSSLTTQKGGIPDIGALSGSQGKALQGLSSDATALLGSSKGGMLKGVLPF